MNENVPRRSLGFFKQTLETIPTNTTITSESKTSKCLLQFILFVRQHSAGNIRICLANDPRGWIHLNSETLQYAKASNNCDIKGREGKWKRVHDISQLVDDSFEIKLRDIRTQHIRQGVFQSNLNWSQIGTLGNESKFYIKSCKFCPVTIDNVNYGKKETVALRCCRLSNQNEVQYTRHDYTSAEKHERHLHTTSYQSPSSTGDHLQVPIDYRRGDRRESNPFRGAASVNIAQACRQAVKKRE